MSTNAESMKNKITNLIYTSTGEIGRPIKIHAFWVEWDDGSRESLMQNIENIDILILEEFGVTSTGWVQTISEEKFQKTLSFIRKTKPNQEITPIINNYNSLSGTWDTHLLATVLSDPGIRDHMEENIITSLAQYSLQGISIDFESIDDPTLPFYYDFLEELHTKMNGKYSLSVNIPINNDSYDYKRIGNAVDTIMIMAYDEHWLTGGAGPIASLDWFADGVTEVLKTVEKEKVTVILGNYGYDWNTTKKTTSALTFQETMALATESDNSIEFDSGSLNPGFSYTDGAGNDHEIWYLDAITAYNQMQVLKKLGVDNVWLWRLGSEDPSIWKILKWDTEESLKNFSYGYALTYDGIGELYKVTSHPKEWVRTIDMESNIITDEDITTYPLPYVITRYGWGSPKKVVLTFDDGPDPVYTPEILDILKQYHAPATFFMVGMSAEKYPNIVKRVYNEEHFIGNHSFSHPEISKIGTMHTDIELSLTERVFESILGHGTSLFRPPYWEDVEPEIPSDILPLIRANDLGYISVGMKIDPNDWSRPWVQEIISSTISQLDDGRGNIVLLHDSGWDRTETVEALPNLIESIRANGYEIVPISDLIWLPRSNIMSETPTNEVLLIIGDAILFYILSLVLWGIFFISTFGLGLSMLRFLIIIALAWRGIHTQKNRKKIEKYTPSVSVIVPAYNEEKVIIRTIESLEQSDYPDFEIIIIDDGSSDQTYELTRDTYASRENVHVFKKENAGKGIAINYGINHADGEIIIVIDADTLFEPSTITSLIEGFQHENIWAVSGNVKVGNRHSFLTKLQAIEYITSQNLDRRAYAAMNAITVVPWAVWAWRKDALEQAWGFSHETLAEDSDLTFMFLKNGYSIAFVPWAIAYTEVPETWKALAKQRFRWSYGILQVTWKHKDILSNEGVSWGLRFFTFPYMILTQTIFPICWPMIDIFAIFWTIFSLVNYYIFDSYHYLSTTIFMLEIAWAFLLLDILIGYIAFSFEPHEEKKLLFYLPLQKFLYRYFMYYIGIKSLVYAISGNRTLWNKLERKNTVTIR